MKKNFRFIGLLIVLFSLILASCSTPTVAPSPTSTATKPTAAAKTKLRWATPPVTMAGYAGVVYIADLLNRTTNLDISVEATAGTDAVPKVMREGVQVGGVTMVQSPGTAYYGWDKFKGDPYPFLRVLLFMIPSFTGDLVGPNSGIKTPYDYKGKRVTYDTAGTNAQVDEMLTLYGIDPKKDLKLVPVSGKANATVEVAEGRADVASWASWGGAKILDMQQKLGKVIGVPMDANKFLEAQKKWPEDFGFYKLETVQPGSILGIDNTEPVLTYATRHTITIRNDVPDEVAYTIVKTIFDNYQTVANSTPEWKGWKPEMAVGAIPFPFHPGSIKAFKERGIWTPELEKEQQRLLQELANRPKTN